MTTKYSKHNNYGCSPGQSIFDALEEGIEIGRFPPKSTVNAFDRVPGPGCAYPEDDDIVGQITVRKNESFWVRRKKNYDYTSAKRSGNLRERRDAIARLISDYDSWDSLGTAAANGDVEIIVRQIK